MEKEVKNFLGIDVSKLTLDVSILVIKDHLKAPMVTMRFDNNAEGIKELDKWLKSQKVSFNENSLLVIENTGVYHRLLWQYCSKHALPIHIGNATHIKWSLGIARGKNDSVDSQRLCTYAYQHAEDLKASPLLDPILIALKDLMTARSSLLAQSGSIQAYIKELKLSNSKEVQKLMEQAHQAALKGLKASIAVLEKQIRKIISDNAAIQTNYELLTTVPGIGPLTAVYIICCTNNFAFKITGKQLACYAGVVPFGYKSGTSIKGRDKVHKMGNKQLKKMLHLCAISTIRFDGEFKTYYERKKMEGKHAMSIINAIRNKIVLRAVAVVNTKNPYVNNYVKAA